MSKVSAYFTVDGIDGKHDIKKLKSTLDTLPGVQSVSVNTKTDCIAVDFDTTGIEKARIQKKIEAFGFDVLTASFETTIL